MHYFIFSSLQPKGKHYYYSSVHKETEVQPHTVSSVVSHSERQSRDSVWLQGLCLYHCSAASYVDEEPRGKEKILTWFMPALAKSKVGSSNGMVADEWT